MDAAKLNELEFLLQKLTNVWNAHFYYASNSVTDASEYSWVAPYATVWLAAGPGGGWWHN